MCELTLVIYVLTPITVCQMSFLNGLLWNITVFISNNSVYFILSETNWILCWCQQA